MPPGKAGSLWGERLKGALTPGAAQSGWLYAQLHLVVPLIFLLLPTNIRPHHGFIQTDCGHHIAARPKHFAGEMSRPTPETTGDRNRTLALEVPHPPRDGILWRKADADMDVIGPQVPFHNLHLLLPGQLMEDFPYMLAQHAENPLLPLLGNKDDVVLTVPSRVA